MCVFVCCLHWIECFDLGSVPGLLLLYRVVVIHFMITLTAITFYVICYVSGLYMC
jgi:hypothetical protein